MKKFLSLVLALIMTMSLVTISAGAAEYKDFTDKDEIKYEEAVAVLNRLGIITGYAEGDFRPEGELTRGAAAKIIVSLLIGPEAAENVSPTAAPYKDVPLDHTFAGPIAYCKTAGIISGYSDGSFQPAGTLTGYAFSKMLLGALGYKSDSEGFTGPGWNMKVASLGNAAKLFNRLDFKGNESVNREQAAQLALNTLKATMVEYTGGGSVVAGDAQVNFAETRTYKTSNQEYATHINNRKASQVGNATGDTHYTVEFGEEHFVDLRMRTERSEQDDFGRPSNEWSYKKVTIGTYPVEADFTYTAQVSHNVKTVTDASKVRDLGLNGLKISDDDTELHVNGRLITERVSTGRKDEFGEDIMKDVCKLNKVAEIADYTDNGTLVEVYVSDTDADLITDVVVVKSQLMEVKRIGSSDVTLSKVEPDTVAPATNEKRDPKYQGFNQNAMHEDVIKVEIDNANFDFLKGLKADDKVVVVPVTKDNGTNYEVAEAYSPETVEGALTRADTYGDVSGRGTIGLTVGGTAYKSSLWNKDIIDVNADSIKYTKNDVKLMLDKYGYVMKAEDIGSTDDFIIIKDYYQSLENGKMVYYLEGWDIKGNEISLNVGNEYPLTKWSRGDLVGYTNTNAKSSADWRLVDNGTALGKGKKVVYKVDNTIDIKASNVRIKISDDETLLKYKDDEGVEKTIDRRPFIANDVKFIYVNYDFINNEVDSIEIKNGVQKVDTDELKVMGLSDKYWTQLCLDKNGDVKAVVIKKESNSAVSSSLLYIRDWDGGYSVDDNGKRVYKYTVAMMSTSGLEDSMEIWADRELKVGDFASYNASTNEGFEPFYKVKEYTGVGKTTSVVNATVSEVINKDKGIFKVSDLSDTTANIAKNLVSDLGVGDETDAVNMIRTEWLDLTGNSIRSVKNLADCISEGNRPRIQMIFNDNKDNEAFRTASLVIITGGIASSSGSGSSTTTPTTQSVSFNVTNAVVKYRLGSSSNWIVYESGRTISVPNKGYVEFTVSSKAGKDAVQDISLGNASIAVDDNGIYTVPAADLKDGNNVVTVSFTAPSAPETPAETPETPAETPETPAESPETPAETPETPAETPTED